MKEHLNDINGKTSIKRVWADRLIKVGVAMNIVYFLLWCHSYATNQTLPEYPTEMIWGMLGAGLTSIGITAFERKI